MQLTEIVDGVLSGRQQPLSAPKTARPTRLSYINHHLLIARQVSPRAMHSPPTGPRQSPTDRRVAPLLPQYSCREVPSARISVVRSLRREAEVKRFLGVRGRVIHGVDCRRDTVHARVFLHEQREPRVSEYV
jgi:hypothetical protein